MKKEMEKELKKCQEERDKYLNEWKRAEAKFLNYKKEEEKRNEELAKYVKEEIIFGILPILDNLEKAKNNIPNESKESEYIKGILQIERQIKNYFKDQGLEEIESVGKDFNPEFYEAVQVVENKKEKSGKIIEEVLKGYILKGKVLRPAKVKVIK